MTLPSPPLVETLVTVRPERSFQVALLFRLEVAAGEPVRLASSGSQGVHPFAEV